jgi:hypothetical protein
MQKADFTQKSRLYAKADFCHKRVTIAQKLKTDFYSLVRFLPHVTVREIEFTLCSFVNDFSRFSLRDVMRLFRSPKLGATQK